MAIWNAPQKQESMSGLSQRIKDENFYKKKFIDHLDTDNEPN